MKPTDWCKCGHVEFDHYSPKGGDRFHLYPDDACWNTPRNIYGISRVCECLKFRPLTNLEWLEKKYDESNKLRLSL